MWVKPVHLSDLDQQRESLEHIIALKIASRSNERKRIRLAECDLISGIYSSVGRPASIEVGAKVVAIVIDFHLYGTPSIHPVQNNR